VGGAPACDYAVKQPGTSAAFDLGLTKESREHYKRRLALMFQEGCAIFGPATAAKLFREHARAAPKEARGRPSSPPRKRRGGHDPEADRLLVGSWNTSNGLSKLEWAKMALKHHAVKNKGKVREQTISPRSLVRRLDRLLKRKDEMRQIGVKKRKP
jgi:hypothetical protein